MSKTNGHKRHPRISAEVPSRTLPQIENLKAEAFLFSENLNDHLTRVAIFKWLTQSRQVDGKTMRPWHFAAYLGMTYARFASHLHEVKKVIANEFFGKDGFDDEIKMVLFVALQQTLETRGEAMGVYNMVMESLNHQKLAKEADGEVGWIPVKLVDRANMLLSTANQATNTMLRIVESMLPKVSPTIFVNQNNGNQQVNNVTVTPSQVANLFAAFASHDKQLSRLLPVNPTATGKRGKRLTMEEVREEIQADEVDFVSRIDKNLPGTDMDVGKGPTPDLGEDNPVASSHSVRGELLPQIRLQDLV